MRLYADSCTVAMRAHAVNRFPAKNQCHARIRFMHGFMRIQKLCYRLIERIYIKYYKAVMIERQYMTLSRACIQCIVV